MIVHGKRRTKMILGPEQDEYQKDYQSTEIVKKIVRDVRDVKGKKKKHATRLIETTVSLHGKATERTVVEFNKKGEKIDKKIFKGEVLDRIVQTFNYKADKRKVLRLIKDFCGINPKLRITTFGLNRIVIDDVSREIEDE